MEDDFYDARTEPEALEPVLPAKRATKPTPVEIMAEFSDAQKSVMEEAIRQAVQLALAGDDVPRNASRALTADLQPSDGYFLPKLDPSVKEVAAHKIHYPRTPFTDHKGEIEYDAWKIEMKLFIEEYSGNFKKGKTQVNAYFKCTGGEAKTIIVQHMDPDFIGTFETAADVLKALDQRFFDHNRVQGAKAKYLQLVMGNMTYNEFRIEFTKYATTGKIARSRWFEDVCDKISPALKKEVKIEKYKMNNDYTTLDEFLAVADRESRNIQAEENANARKSSTVGFEDSRGRQLGGILKKEGWKKNDWRSTSPAPVTRSYSPAGSYARSPSPAVLHTAPTTVPAGTTCRHCGKADHWVKDCPDLAQHREMDRKIAAMILEDDSPDQLPKNS